jgi:hypothetical protein
MTRPTVAHQLWILFFATSVSFGLVLMGQIDSIRSTMHSGFLNVCANSFLMERSGVQTVRTG